MDLAEGLEHIVRRNEPLAAYSWFRLGGSADYFAEPTNVEELTELVRRCRAAEMPVRLLGGGSNLLVVSDLVSGLVVHLAAPAFGTIEHQASELVAGGGAKLGHVIAHAAREGLGGIETLIGIPGTVGGALRGNAGCPGNDIGQWTREVTVLTRDGELQTRGETELRFGYRESSLDDLAILSAKFQLEPRDVSEITRRMQKTWIVKRAKEPTGEFGHGRVFGDPHGMTATDLIEQAGLRNSEEGGARLCERNPNFIEVTSDATVHQIMKLIERIQREVNEQLNVELKLQLDVW